MSIVLFRKEMPYFSPLGVLKLFSPSFVPANALTPTDLHESGTFKLFKDEPSKARLLIDVTELVNVILSRPESLKQLSPIAYSLTDLGKTIFFRIDIEHLMIKFIFFVKK